MLEKTILPECLSENVQRVISAYFRDFSEVRIQPLGNGNINETYLAETHTTRLVIQKISRKVFPRPETVADNSTKVSSYLSEMVGSKALSQVVQIIPTRAGQNFFRDGCGEIWRAQRYIENSVIYETINDTRKAREVGRCLGDFHRCMAAFTPEELQPVLPGFHDLPLYLAHFDVAADRAASESSAILDYCITGVEQNRKNAFFFIDGLKNGDLNTAIVHGDPKVSNIIFSTKTGRAVALIDLDTVGPGLLLQDIGDCLRSSCFSGGEEAFGQPVECNVDVIVSVIQGYLERNSLSLFEKKTIYLALLLLSYELGVRFLTDHLLGNRYFVVKKAGDNLRRAYVQFQLVASIEQKRDEINRAIAQLIHI